MDNENQKRADIGVPLKRLVLRGWTEQKAIEREMHYEEDLQCPECGCPWYGNKDFCGEGHRECVDCRQEWWTDIEYSNAAERRELPKSENAEMRDGQ